MLQAVLAGVVVLVPLWVLVPVWVLVVTAQAAGAGDGRPGPARWLTEEHELRALAARPPKSVDAVTRLLEHCRRHPVGVRPLVTLLPPEATDGLAAELPTIAFFARAHGRTLVSLTRVRPGADAGQDVVMQRTLVSDLFAGRRLSLTVYEDHALGDAATRLLGIGTRLTFRPTIAVGGWRFRVELLGSLDLDTGASGYLALTGVLHAPPLPVLVPRAFQPAE